MSDDLIVWHMAGVIPLHDILADNVKEFIHADHFLMRELTAPIFQTHLGDIVQHGKE